MKPDLAEHAGRVESATVVRNEFEPFPAFQSMSGAVLRAVLTKGARIFLEAEQSRQVRRRLREASIRPCDLPG